MREGEQLDSSIEKLNFGDCVDVDLLGCNQRFLVVDAPTGSGKTELAMHYCRHLREQGKRVLIITFRISLAQYLATRLELTSYQESGVFSAASMRRDGFVCCLDSIGRIPPSEK